MEDTNATTNTITNTPVDAEVVEDQATPLDPQYADPTDVVASGPLDTETLDATQGLIVRLSQQLDDLSKQQKDQREMLKSIFENDERLQEAEAVIDAQSKAAKTRKSELGGSQQAIDIKLKIADLAEDIKMVQESLNTHLLNYYQLTNSKTVDFPGGEEREMDIRAKLKKSGPKQ